MSASSLAVPRSDVRGPVVTPIETAGTPVAPETLQAMVAAYESRASLISIAREHRLGKETVRDLLVDAGVRIRRQGLDDEQVAHAVRGYESGLTTREIARELGIGHSMVWRALKRAEVESRPNTRRVGRKLSKQ
ncbi:MAG: helix-turn-helix domain-containing protein [Leucobacter sp.]